MMKTLALTLASLAALSGAPSFGGGRTVAAIPALAIAAAAPHVFGCTTFPYLPWCPR